MNEPLFASIYVDSNAKADDLATMVAELTGGTIARRGVDTPWARIAIDDDYGDFEVRQADADDFLGWPVLLEVMPHDGTSAADVVPRVRALTEGFLARGHRIL